MDNILNILVNNKSWLFSGFGIALISIFANLFTSHLVSKRNKSQNLTIQIKSKDGSEKILSVTTHSSEEDVAKMIQEIKGNEFVDLTPFPNSVSTSSLDEVIANQGHLVHKLKAKDSTGRWAYYFVFVESDLEKAFLQALKSEETIDFEDFGKVLASCYGEEPNAQVKLLLKEKYGFIV